MAYNDLFRLSSHAVITNQQNDVLLLRANYGERFWGLPGGALDASETVHEALIRECKEELSCDIKVQYLSGIYYHAAHNSQAFIFRCDLADGAQINLSKEHSEYKFVSLENLSNVQRIRVKDCLNFDGAVVSRKF